jgi:FAD/FMN-containing dehydrogenase
MVGCVRLARAPPPTITNVSSYDRRAFLTSVGSLVASATLLPDCALAGSASAAVDPALRALAKEVRGPVFDRSSPAFARGRLTYNERFDSVQPRGIVRPVSVADIRATVLWARRNDVHLVARAGGHSYAGYSTTQGGLVVDLRRMNGIIVDRGSGTVTVGAGARMIDLQAALARHGCAIPTGSCATVGIAGLALGGGIGFVSRAFGTASDNLRSIGIVTADGRYLVCDAARHHDLFWACRGGGGGNFGIVTHFVFRTRPVETVSYFVARWPWDAAKDVVGTWQRFAPAAPDNLFAICALGAGSGGLTVQCLGQHLGAESELRNLLAPLRGVDGAELSTGSSSYLDAQLRWAGCLGKTVGQCHSAGESPDGTLGRAKFRAKSDYLAEPLTRVGIALVTRWIERAQQRQFRSVALLLDSYGGAINRVPPDATAFVHRNALFSAQYLAYWDRASDEAGAASWLRGFHGEMRPHVSGFAYQNYVDPDLADWRHAYYGANYERLRFVKKRVDPDWFFRFPQAIEPER